MVLISHTNKLKKKPDKHLNFFFCMSTHLTSIYVCTVRIALKKASLLCMTHKQIDVFLETGVLKKIQNTEAFAPLGVETHKNREVE